MNLKEIHQVKDSVTQISELTVALDKANKELAELRVLKDSIMHIKDEKEEVEKDKTEIQQMFEERVEEDTSTIQNLSTTIKDLTSKLESTSTIHLAYDPDTSKVSLNGQVVDMEWEEVLAAIRIISVINPEASVSLTTGEVGRGADALKIAKKLKDSANYAQVNPDALYKFTDKENGKVSFYKEVGQGKDAASWNHGMKYQGFDQNMKKQGGPTYLVGNLEEYGKWEVVSDASYEVNPAIFKVIDEVEGEVETQAQVYTPAELAAALEAAIDSADFTLIDLNLVPEDLRDCFGILINDGGFFGMHDDKYEELKAWIAENKLDVPSFSMIKDSILLNPTTLGKVNDSLKTNPIKQSLIIGTPSKLILSKSSKPLDNVIKINEEVSLYY